jgi:hypothetical protein
LDRLGRKQHRLGINPSGKYQVGKQPRHGSDTEHPFVAMHPSWTVNAGVT